jgi:Tol biopolymer transport system component
MKTGLWSRPRPPVQLTNGPLSYTRPVVSRDGKQIFAVGIKARGELVRYDAKLKQFLPLLPGVAAFNPSFSADGRWVAYTVYPDHSLWRSRADGSDPLQLTFPPSETFYPAISPDGKQVAYATSSHSIDVISMDGGPPKTLAAADAGTPSWSPDGNRLLFVDHGNTARNGIVLTDLGSEKRSTLPASNGLYNVRWAADDLIAATTSDSKKLVIFDLKTRKWSDLVSSKMPGYVVMVACSPDHKYLFYTTGGAEPMAFRVRLADHKVETITSLKGLTLAVGPGGNTQFGVTPDGSPVFTRDTGTQEIFALTVKWP